MRVDWRPAARYGVALGATLFVARTAGAAVHECGHLVVALLFGARLHGFHLYRFGTGDAVYDLPPGTGSLMATAGGIAVSTIAGALALVFARRARHRLLGGMFLASFGVIAVLGVLAYLSLGLYYQWGDPASILSEILHKRPEWLLEAPLRTRGLWVPWFTLAPFVAYAVFRRYIAHQDAWLPIEPGRTRLPTTCVAGLFALLMLAPFLAAERLWMPPAPPAGMSSATHAAELEQVAEAEWRLRRIREIRAREPSLEPREVERRVAAESIQRSHSPYGRPAPMWIIFPAVIGAGGLAAFSRASPAASAFPSRPHGVTFAQLVLASAAALAVLVALLASRGNFVASG